jgi:iron(III) transport system substrate-binding protein
MFKNRNFLVVLLAICFLMGTFNVAQGKKLPADVEKWLKKNKIGPYQEDKVDYKALYKAAKKEEKVVMYASTSRGPKSLALGFYNKYPGIKVEWNTISVSGIMSRIIKEQKAGIYNADLIYTGDYSTHINVLHPANMVFPWVPPDLKKVIPKEYQEPLFVPRLAATALFYNFDTWSDKPPIDSWWDITKPEWKGRLVIPDPRIDAPALEVLLTFVLNAEEMAKDYERVFGKPLKLTTKNAGYEWIKMFFANKPKLVKKDKEARYIGKAGQKKPSLGVCWDLARITDTDNPKYGNLKLQPVLDLKPRMGIVKPVSLNVTYKAPHPNAAKILIRWLLGDEKGGSGFAPWFHPGRLPTRTDIKEGAPHPFNPKLSWTLKDLDLWFIDAQGMWKEKRKVLNFIEKQL